MEEDGGLFSSDERAILALGLGKNMVKSIRFWGQAFGLLQVQRRVARNTEFARQLLDENSGIDPYLEDLGSLWRLHWVVTTQAGLGAWVTTFLELQDRQITRDRLIDVVHSRAAAVRGSVAQRTVTTHVDIFLRTYDWARFDAERPGEDASGCPFQELRLIETSTVNGQTYVSVTRGGKPQLDTGAFAFALNDYWQGTAPGSRSVSVRSLLVEQRSPGVVFRLDEGALYACIEDVCNATGLQMRSDGAGGTEVVDSGGEANERLKEVAWHNELIAERIDIARRYVRAVDIARDLEDARALEDYVVTPSVRDGLRRVLAGDREGVFSAGFSCYGTIRVRQVLVRSVPGATVPGRFRSRNGDQYASATRWVRPRYFSLSAHGSWWVGVRVLRRTWQRSSRKSRE